MHAGRTARSSSDDQVADTCFRFLMPTKERYCLTAWLLKQTRRSRRRNVRRKGENRSYVRQQHNQTRGPTRIRLSRSAGSYIEAFSTGALTELSRIVLLQAIVPESSPSQASCQCVEIHNYIELRYKLC
ncbi:hypothetical protein PUN28_000666 [Cardiocondyla obscurior]|uniref:Uncharacterized protein n=1 Tax=Cardiocondyla obscurior TaxID=286306 RepID=A0AAW2H0W3_9HYME